MNFIKKVRKKCVRLRPNFDNEFCLEILYKKYMKLKGHIVENYSLKYLNRFKLNQKKVKEFLKDYMDEEECGAILKLISFHSDDFFRRKALIKLREKRNPNTSPFILIRFADLIYKIIDESDEIYNESIKSKLVLEKVYGLKFKRVVIDKFYKYGLYKSKKELEGNVLWRYSTDFKAVSYT